MKIPNTLLKQVKGGTSGGGVKTDPPDSQAKSRDLGTKPIESVIDPIAPPKTEP